MGNNCILYLQLQFNRLHAIQVYLVHIPYSINCVCNWLCSLKTKRASSYAYMLTVLSILREVVGGGGSYHSTLLTTWLSHPKQKLEGPHTETLTIVGSGTH